MAENKEQLNIRPKMRIQLLDQELRVQSDRLVDQYTEFNAGPKLKHKDPIRLEVCLISQNDINQLKTYLDVLAGDLPIKEIAGRGRPASTTISKDLESPRENIMMDIERDVDNDADQDTVIYSLRKLGFVFLLTEDFLYYFPDFPFREKDIGSPNRGGQYPDSYCWLVRRIKLGKDPKTDKYDPMIIFGFKMLGKRSDRFVSYLYKNFYKRFKAPVPDKKALTFEKFEMAKMPAYMTEEERLKWSSEMRQLMSNPEKKPSKFFLRWSSEITLPKGHVEKLNHLNIF